MKYFIFLLIPFSAFAFTPTMNSGEAKILYSCEALSEFPTKSEENTEITFYEKELFLYKQGIILRKREKFSETDFTVKYRPASNKEVDIDESIYNDLSSSQTGELKCEYDITYNEDSPEMTSSCSFKTPTSNLTVEHYNFISMAKLKIPSEYLQLSHLGQPKVKSTSWKLRVTPGPLSKSPVLERWEIKGECLLELSGRFNFENQEAMKTNLPSVFNYLKSIVKSSPLKKQGNKTLKALTQ
ncbi:MAG: hypothetical protein AB7I27_19095 [Bacteriovoracaceae bacterium]